ncbi:MAG: tyrosine-protein phosphatase [Muribaculaceae bacterium]|nr:tyrosine-protein phosphatase [Muribaculaceae bacterium]
MKIRFTALLVTLSIAAASTSAQQIFNVENEVVARYLAETSYNTDLYDTTAVKSYMQIPTDYRKDMPRQFSVTLSDSHSRVMVSEDRTFSSDVSTVTPDSCGIATLGNLIPGRNYYYRILDPSGNVTYTDSIRTTGTVRMISAGGLHNVRDLGGWKTASGKTVRYGMIFRGAELDGNHNIHITPQGTSTLRDELGIRADLDLRGAAEINGQYYSPLGCDVKYDNVPLMGYFCVLNGQLVSEAFHILLDNLRNNRPTYFHCYGGADRTGSVALLILGLLGVDENSISLDYELTSFSFVNLRARNNVDTKHGDFGTMMRHIKLFPGKNLEEKFHAYLISLGITPQEIEEFKQLMLT